MKYYLLIIYLSILSSLNIACSENYLKREDVIKWSENFIQKSQIDKDWLRDKIIQAKKNNNVIKLMTPSPEKNIIFDKNWQNYRNSFVNDERIKAGINFWKNNLNTLKKAEEIYGVPAEIIVGIIGVETLFGQKQGKIKVLDSLITLAFDFPKSHPRYEARQKYFRTELENFLVNSYKNKLDIQNVFGSYAGASGFPQFMPSSISKYAVDFDNDGKIDLNNSQADAIGSVANYLSMHGWIKNLPVWFKADFNKERLNKDNLNILLKPDILPTFNQEKMINLGINFDNENNKLDNKHLLALVELLNGKDNSIYTIGTKNFYVITRYNQSSYYALAVYELGQEIKAKLFNEKPLIVETFNLN